MATLLRSFFPDLLGLMAQAGFLGDAIDHLVLLLDSFQILLPFVFRLLMLFHIIIPTSHRPSHYILDGLFGTHALPVLGTM